MKKALGLVEIKGLPSAVVVADTMVKAANITLEEIENTKGLGWLTIKVTGDVGAVTAAVNAGKQIGMIHGAFVTAKIIPRPSDFIETFFYPHEKENIQSPKQNTTTENITTQNKEEPKEQPKKNKKKSKKLIIKEKSKREKTVEEKIEKEEPDQEIINLIEDSYLEQEVLQEQTITENEQIEISEQISENLENQTIEQQPSDSENND